MGDDLNAQYLNCYTPAECHKLFNERQKQLLAERQKQDKKELDAFSSRMDKITGMMNIQQSSWVKFIRWTEVMGQDTSKIHAPDFSVSREDIRQDTLREVSNNEKDAVNALFNQLDEDNTLWDTADYFKMRVEELWNKTRLSGTKREIKRAYAEFLKELDKNNITLLMENQSAWSVPELVDMDNERYYELYPDQNPGKKRRSSLVKPEGYAYGDTSSQQYAVVSQEPLALQGNPHNPEDKYCVAKNISGANKGKRCGQLKLDGSIYCATHRSKLEANP